MAFFKFKGTDQRLADDGPDALADDLHRTLEIAQAAFEAEDIALLYVDVDANGGKLFCSSGIPVTSEDDEGRMLRAARSIVDAEPPLALQVGIHRGHVFAGELGARDQAVFSIMGDTVNTAARIMVTAPPGVIHAHPAVLETARTRYDTEPQGPFTFKGKAQPQVVYRVGDELGPRESTDGHDLRFHGRDAELADLRAARRRRRRSGGRRRDAGRRGRSRQVASDPRSTRFRPSPPARHARRALWLEQQLPGRPRSAARAVRTARRRLDRARRRRCDDTVQQQRPAARAATCR